MHEDDKNLAVKFFKKSIQNNFESRRKGKPVFTKLDYISIIIPGNRSETRERKVTEQDKERFAPIWDKYLKNEEILQDGIMLEMLPGIDETQINHCKALNIITIEQLANLSEEGLRNIGYGSRDLKEMANKYLKGTGAVKEMKKEVKLIHEENEQLRASNEVLQSQIDELKGEIDELTDDSTKRRRRNSTGGKTGDGSGQQRSILKAVSGVIN